MLGVRVGRRSVGSDGCEAVHRFPNEPVRTADGLHWDIDGAVSEVLIGLRRAGRANPTVVSIGIDTWAVDYGLLSGGRLLAEPVPYRDERTARGVAPVHEVVSQAELYAATGCSSCRSTPSTSWRPTQQDGRLDAVDHDAADPRPAGLLADREPQVAERTNASTTGLLDLTAAPGTRHCSSELGSAGLAVPAAGRPGHGRSAR